ncbi:cell surface protein, partial [Vibrio vulnificus]
EDGDLVVPVVNAVFGNEQKGSSFVYNKDGPAKELKVWGTTLNVGFGCNDNAPSPMGCGPANKPVASGLQPPAGPLGGGTVVKVDGSNLFGASQVSFGDKPGTDIAVAQDGNSLTVKTPAVDAAGPVEVKVSTPNGSATATDKFEYVGSDQHPDIHAPDGATPVTGKWWSGDNNTYGGWFKDGQWVLQKPNAGSVSVAFGNPGDTPVTGDWDGKGKTSIGVTRSTANGLEWYITSDLTTANP